MIGKFIANIYIQQYACLCVFMLYFIYKAMFLSQKIIFTNIGKISNQIKLNLQLFIIRSQKYFIIMILIFIIIFKKYLLKKYNIQMSQTINNSIVLKKSNQNKLNLIILNFAKTQPNVLKFSQLFQLLIDRCIFHNRLPFSAAFQIFQRVAKVKPVVQVQKKDTTGSTSVDNQKFNTQKQITRQQFMYFITELGKILYKDEKNFQDKIFNELLSEKVSSDKNLNIEHSRILTFDEINRKLLGQLSIATILLYQSDTKALFNSYIGQNYWSVKKSKRFLLSNREINLQNKKMEAAGLVLFLKQSQICPHHIGIELVQQILRLIVPSSNGKELDFYYKHYLTDVYNHQLQKLESTKHANDPGIMFFEFQLLIARIGFECYPKQLEKKNINEILIRFFQKILMLRPKDSLNHEIQPTKKHLIKLKQYYQIYSLTDQLEPNSKQSSKQIQNKQPRLLMAEKHQAQILKLPVANLDIVQILKNLQKDLPKLPPKPQPRKQNPPPFKDQKIIIGQMPPPQQQDNDKGKKQQKKNDNKKQEQPQRVFPWADPPKYSKSSEDYFQQLASKLAFQTKPLSSLQRGVINRDPIPTLVCQILFPPEIPQAVQPLLKSARHSMLQKNYVLALQNYNAAYNAWKVFAKKRQQQIPNNIQLFFDYTKGSIYTSAGRDDHALLAFYNCRKHVESGKMGFVNPDRALPYCGIGQVLYQLEQYQLSARAYLKAREIREGILGIQNVQTANIFNNLGACYFMLGRAIQALGYTQIAQAVFSAQLGPYHERTMTSRANLKKLSKGEFDHQPQYRKLWQVYEKDEFVSAKKKKAATKKK